MRSARLVDFALRQRLIARLADNPATLDELHTALGSGELRAELSDLIMTGVVTATDVAGTPYYEVPYYCGCWRQGMH